MSKKFQFAFVPSIGGKAQVMTRELFESVINNRDVRRVVEQIRATKDKEERAKLKKKLTAICWHAWFEDGVRKNSHAHASGLVMIDLDHIDNPRDVYAGIDEKAKAMGLVCAHVTPSGEGLRLVFVIPENMGIVKAQQYFAKALNLTNVDECTKDLARLSFLVPQEDWLYIDWDVIFGDKEPPRFDIDIHLIGQKEEVPTPQKSHEPGPVHEAGGMPAGIDDKQYTDCYKGIPIIDIISAYEQSKGGAPIPEPGNGRNIFYYNMALTLRGVFDNDPQWVFKALPAYGMEAQERWNTAQSACSYPFKGLTKEAKAIIEKLSGGNGNAVTGARNWWESAEAPRMPKRLPDAVFRTLKILPEFLRPTAVNEWLCALGIYFSNVKIKDMQDSLFELTLLVVTAGYSGCGKSSAKAIVNIVKKEVEDAYRAHRKKKQEWKEACRKLGANKDKPAEPKFCNQILPDNITSASVGDYFQQAEDFGGLRLLLWLNEFTYISNVGDSRGNNYDIITKAYDVDMWRQARRTKDADDILATVRMNIISASTIDMLRKKLGQQSMLNGVLSRLVVNLMEYHTLDYKKPEPDDAYKDMIKKQIEVVKSAKGVLDCPEAIECETRLKHEADMCIENGLFPSAYYGLAMRAKQIALGEAVMLWLLNDRKWTPEIEAMMVWFYRYNMWCKIHIFGDMLETAGKKETLCKINSQPSILDLLPETWTLEQLMQARAEFAQKYQKPIKLTERGAKDHLKVLKNRHEVKDEGNGLYRKLNKAS